MTISNLATRARRAIQGVTLVELLVVLLIISLLATAAVPVLLNRIEDARVATARQDVEEIAKAQTMCALYHSVYVPLQVLDDLPYDAGAPTIEADDVNNSSDAVTYFLINLTQKAEDQETTQLDFDDDDQTNNPLGFRVIRNWQGPFINYQRVWTNNKERTVDVMDQGELRRGYPLDPWGTPYRFYSPIGIIGAGANSTSQASYNQDSFMNGRIQRDAVRLYDRYAIVSYGPDGLAPNAAADSNDNISYLFGTDGIETGFNF